MIPTIDIGTKVRSVALFVALLNQFLAMFGFSPIPFDDEQVELVASTVFTGIVSIFAWWHDNDITRKARLQKKTK